MRLKASIPLFIAYIALTLILPVFAEDPVDVSEFPQRLADAINMPLIAGQMLASSLVLALFLFPTMLLLNHSSFQVTAVLIVSVMVMGTLIAFSWLPYWFLLVIALIVALGYAGRFREFLSGG